MKHSIYKVKSSFIIIFLIVQSFILQAQQSNKILFNDGWKFHKGDISLEESKIINDQIWRHVDLPHDWSVEGPFSDQWASGTGYLPAGIAWYKKTFDITNWQDNNRYAIYFDGIYKNSEIWINGHFLGKKPNGFIPIQYDLTPYIKAEGNLIIVKVDHSEYADSRYYTGSGIYRNVYLITQNQHHFSQWGIFFKTSDVKVKSALAEVDVEVENHEGKTSNVNIKATLKDNNGAIIAQSDKMLQSEPEKNNLTKLSFKIKNPIRWLPDSPYLYQLSLELWSDGKLMDQWDDRVGVRDFEFDPNEGFFLNGENMLLKGVCMHHDAGALGAAVPKQVWRKRLETLKKLGCNAIRMSHYPHQDYIYDLCDEMGFLVQDEAFDEWEVGKNKWIEGWNVGTPGNENRSRWYHTGMD